MTQANDLINQAFAKQSCITGEFTSGLTKREHFAVMALQGLVSKYTMNDPEDQKTICKMAVELSDSLIKQLNA